MFDIVGFARILIIVSKPSSTATRISSGGLRGSPIIDDLSFDSPSIVGVVVVVFVSEITRSRVSTSSPPSPPPLSSFDEQWQAKHASMPPVRASKAAGFFSLSAIE